MYVAFASLAVIIFGLLLIKRGFSSDPDRTKRFKNAERFIPFLFIFLGLIGLLSRTFLTVDASEVGLLKRIHLAPSLPPGKITGCVPGQPGYC